MLTDDAKNKIQDIISGTYIDWQNDTCTAARNFLCSSFSPSTTVKEDFDHRALIKKEQAAALTVYIDEKQLWVERPRRNDYYNKSLGLILEDIHDEKCDHEQWDHVFYVDLAGRQDR